jgi:hypothetical protein
MVLPVIDSDEEPNELTGTKSESKLDSVMMSSTKENVFA